MLKHIVHHSRSPLKRGIFSLFIVMLVMTFGTVGLHMIEGVPWLKSFYFMSMIATAQGPLYTPETSAGLIFTALMAFVSVGTVVAALGFIFGPFFGVLWRIGVYKLEGEHHFHKSDKP